MALNTALVGKQYAPLPPYAVSREKIREFATAIGDPAPAYTDPEAAVALGYPDVIAPPTFPFVLGRDALAQAMFDPELGLDYSRVVHGEQTFSYERPIHAGDVLIGHSRIADIRAAGPNELLVSECELRTSDGELVVTSRSLIISRGTAS
jgi:acyl dehydratase